MIRYLIYLCITFIMILTVYGYLYINTLADTSPLLPNITCTVNPDNLCVDPNLKPISFKKYLALKRPTATYKYHQYGRDIGYQDHSAYIYYE